MIYLHTLGDTLIKVGEKEIRPASPMLFAALLYLGMERGRRVPRAALQELFFPNVDERSGAHSLRQLLYKLRQLGTPIEVDSSTVIVPVQRVRDDAAMDLDDHENVRRLACGFLPDYEPHLSERFSEWLERLRSTISAEMRKRLVAAIQANRESLNWPAVERLAQALLVFDPYNEVATFGSAESAALSGGKAAAIRMLSTYEQETGRSDLRLPAALLRRRISESVPDPVTRIPLMPFTGREAEVRELRKHIATARAGKPAMYVIGGEAGIGKTRLLEETTALAALEGTKVHIVRCQSHYSSRPLSVFIELVPALRASRGALGVSPESLACLNLLTSHTDGRTDQPTDARDDVTRSELLLAAVRDLVDAVASEQPLIIGVEDAHWADADSLRELNRMVQGAPHRSLMVICTTRMPESFPTLQKVDDRSVIHRLKPLSMKPMNDLALHLLPEQPDVRREELAAWCVSSAAGNPLFLQTLCAHYAKTGKPYAVPADLLSAIARRLEQLPQQCRRILEFSALLGKHSTMDALRSLAACTPLQLLDAVQRLEEEGYLQFANDVVRAHDLLSECALNMVPPLSRRVLHSCVAATLETRYDLTHDASLLWDCAEQWKLSGETDKVIYFLRHCAQHSAQIGRAAESLRLLQQARELATLPAHVREILMDMLLAAKAAGRWDIASEVGAHVDSHFVTTHGEHEIISIEAASFVKGEIAASQARAIHCLQASTSDVAHRIAAARLLLVIAQELCDASLANQVYLEISPFLAAESTSFYNRTIPLLYHSVFGDRQLVPELAKKLAADLHLFSVTERLRVASNAIAVFTFVGAFDEALTLAKQYSAMSSEWGLRTWQHDISSYACSILITQNKHSEAMTWYGQAEYNEPNVNRGAFGSVHLANSAELAIWRKDAVSARNALRGLAGLGPTTPRMRSYLSGLEYRIHQLDPLFTIDDIAFQTLMRSHALSCRFVSADGLTIAIAEDLTRRGRTAERQQFLSEYFASARREGSSLPMSFERLIQTKISNDESPA